MQRRWIIGPPCLRISGKEPSGERVVVTRPIVSRAVAVLSDHPRPHLLTAADMGHRHEQIEKWATD
jgi:hypothetical protein